MISILAGLRRPKEGGRFGWVFHLMATAAVVLVLATPKKVCISLVHIVEFRRTKYYRIVVYVLTVRNSTF